MRRWIVSLVVLLNACSSAPPLPPHWGEGGAPLELGPATWDRADDDPITIDAQGRIFEGQTFRFIVDERGRIADEDRNATAVLLPTGELIGRSGVYLGRIGVANASPPQRETAWLTVRPDGTVQQFSDDGERSLDGRWRGCEGARRRTCTLVTHLVALERYRAGAPRFGVGVGIFVPY